MPAQNPPSFASAAASNGTGEGGTTRGSSGDWSRNRMNGTQTFRRPSQLNTSLHQRESSQNVQSPSAGVYVPPHMNSSLPFSARSSNTDNRYSKDQLLENFKAQSQTFQNGKDFSDLLTEGWAPGQPSNIASGGGWGRREDPKETNYGPDICWDEEGATQPLALVEMDDEEKEMFSVSVNSLLKPSQTSKEGVQTPGVNVRKQSISQGTLSSGRPGTRRRDTSDSFSGNPLASPTYARGGARDDISLASPPPTLLRRKTDTKDTSFSFGERLGKLDTSEDTRSLFGSLKRTTANPMSAGVSGPNSPWVTSTPQSAGFGGSMGAFGNFAINSHSGQPGTPGDKKELGSIRGSSRFFQDARSKDGSDDVPKQRNTSGGFGRDRLAEADPERRAQGPQQAHTGRGREQETAAGSRNVGSAALGGDDASLPTQQPYIPGLEHERTNDEIGFASFGQGSNMSNFRERLQQRQSMQHESEQQHFQEPMSPTDTNPFHSPERQTSQMERNEMDEDPQEMLQNTYGMNHHGKPHAFDVSDHDSRTSSAGPRAVSGLASIGPIGSMSGASGWPTQHGSLGGPSKSNQFGGENIFGALGDIGSSGAAGVFSAPGAAYGGFGAIGGTQRSKLGSLYSTTVQEQGRNEPQRQDYGFGSMGGVPARDTDSPAHSGRGVLDDLFAGLDGRAKGVAASSTSVKAENPYTQAQTQPFSGMTSSALPTPAIGSQSQQNLNGSFFGRAQEVDVPNQMPAAQQRQMVMPDRMRWIYRDPQGSTQGPWSGLEMHDWYKAGFFSPELQVKKLEDADYEPLAQLIRRIGNSREPFLVPQIGIPHGSAVAQGTTAPSSMSGLTATAGMTGNAQPPFASSFPSFGTTLTAEQQNALERRKQEEQYLMARQKEVLAQQQALMKQQMHLGGAPMAMHPGQLHHHSSAHSLQSQPSFGSIASPPGAFPSASGQMPIGQGAGMPGFFDLQNRQGFGPVNTNREHMHQGSQNDLAASLDRLNLGPMAQSPFGPLSHSMMPGGLSHEQQLQLMRQDRARLQREQELFDLMQRGAIGENRDRESTDRLDQFRDLRGQESAQAGVIGRPHTQHSIETYVSPTQILVEKPATTRQDPATIAKFDVVPTGGITTAKGPREEPKPARQPPWQSIEQVESAPTYPPQSISPLPAPSAQRNRTHVADALAADTRSRSQTPSLDTPGSALAPWAKDLHEGGTTSKGPSLKEIQEVEARQAAKHEEIAAAARRALLEQERLAQANVPAVAPAAPGLPSGANWAAAQSTGSPTAPSGGSAWAKPIAGKLNTTTPSAKKTLAQIQKEEEARKNRVAAAAAIAAAATNVNTAPGAAVTLAGKRYADLASKSVPTPNGLAVGGAWTTVGAGGGKAKVPGAPGLPQRTASGSVQTSNLPASSAVKRPAAPTRVATGTLVNPVQQANDELMKWAKASLGKGLNAGINADDLVRSLIQFPPEVDIISDTIYSASTTLDGRRFADEFIRRRKLAEKGIVAPADPSGALGFGTAGNTGPGSAGSKDGAGGWSEVAKKGPANAQAKEDHGSQFKVVAAKKKAKR